MTEKTLARRVEGMDDAVLVDVSKTSLM